MSDVRHQLSAALYGALTGDAGLDSILAGGKVFDRVPRGAAHPFVSFGDMVSRRLDGDDAPVSEHLVDVLVHSREAGQKEASDIAERVIALLDDAALLMPDYRLASLRHRDTQVSASRDRRAYRVRLRFRAITEAL
ncbi:MAG: DUF3168 domain-containing protein [Devosia sp.]